jgi:hypothetical protein
MSILISVEDITQTNFMKKTISLVTSLLFVLNAFCQNQNEKSGLSPTETTELLEWEEITGPDAARTMVVQSQENSNIPNNIPICAACSTIKITVPTTSTILFYNNNTFSVAHAMSISSTPTRYVRSIRAELNYFDYVPDSENCLACNKNSNTFGNINGGTIGGVTDTANGTHNLNINYSPAKAPGSFPVLIRATMPPTVNCCLGTLRICIRYVVTFDDCTVCSQTVCYEKKKTGSLIAVPIDQSPN